MGSDREKGARAFNSRSLFNLLSKLSLCFCVGFLRYVGGKGGVGRGVILIYFNQYQNAISHSFVAFKLVRFGDFNNFPQN